MHVEVEFCLVNRILGALFALMHKGGRLQTFPWNASNDPSLVFLIKLSVVSEIGALLNRVHTDDIT